MKKNRNKKGLNNKPKIEKQLKLHKSPSNTLLWFVIKGKDFKKEMKYISNTGDSPTGLFYYVMAFAYKTTFTSMSGFIGILQNRSGNIQTYSIRYKKRDCQLHLT